MKPYEGHSIYTIGHSTHPLQVFLKMLSAFSIQVLVDIRRFPASKKFPQFNQDYLETALLGQGIGYTHFKALGGRRPAHKGSHNIRWKNDSFRGYADYMETEDFKIAVADLEALALKKTVVLMCAESLWWRCHRSMVADYLKARGWTVMHIMGPNQVEEHPFTAPARVVKESVFYNDIDLQN